MTFKGIEALGRFDEELLPGKLVTATPMFPLKEIGEGLFHEIPMGRLHPLLVQVGVPGLKFRPPNIAGMVVFWDVVRFSPSSGTMFAEILIEKVRGAELKSKESSAL